MKDPLHDFDFIGWTRYLDPGLFTDELIVGALINVLEAAPSAYVKDQDRLVVALPTPDVGYQLSQRGPCFKPQAAAGVVFIGLDDRKATSCRIFSYHGGLVFYRVLLVFR